VSEEKRYRQVSIKKEFVDNVEDWIKTHPEAGYSSIADIATEALRLRLQELKSQEFREKRSPKAESASQ
jgi:hypothetical protein